MKRELINKKNVKNDKELAKKQAPWAEKIVDIEPTFLKQAKFLAFAGALVKSKQLGEAKQYSINDFADDSSSDIRDTLIRISSNEDLSNCTKMLVYTTGDASVEGGWSWVKTEKGRKNYARLIW